MATKVSDVWSKVHEVKNQHCSNLLRNPHVKYIGVSFKEKGGQPTDTPTIQVAVKRKLPLAKLSDGEKIPSFLDGIPTDVIEDDLDLVVLGDKENVESVSAEVIRDPSTYGTKGCFIKMTEHIRTNLASIAALSSSPTASAIAGSGISPTGSVVPHDIITSGMSMAKYSKPEDYGTVGCFMTVTGSPKLAGITVGEDYLVTCQHVVKGASPSDRIIIPAQKIYDRSSYTNGKVSYKVDKVDVAAIKLDEGVHFKNEVPKATSTIPFAGIFAGWPNPGTLVFKYGATTGYTEGTVKATDVTSTGGDYHGIMMIDGKRSGSHATVFADTGDSGSVLVITSNSQITGQLFAVSGRTKIFDGGYTRAYAYPMDRQLSALAGSWELSLT